jgi:outer membrane cobalamin receptor
MRPSAFSLFPFASSLLFCTAAAAGPVTGRLLDPDGRSVAGAGVLLVQGTQIIGTTVSRSDGRFTLNTPDEGRFEVRVALDGLRAQPVAVTSRTEPLDIGDVRLTVSTITESVVVSAAQTEVPLSTTASSVSVIAGEELKARQVESVVDALRFVPGLSVSAAGGRGALTGISPRGGETDYSLVVVDGVQANAFGGGFDFAHLPVVNIDRVEVVRGPQSALYGSNAIGSVVRVITKRSGRPSADASFEGGSFGTRRATAATSGSRDEWHWTGSAERLDSDGMTGERSSAGETIVNDDYTRYTLAGGGGWTAQRGTEIRGDLRFSSDERGFPGPYGSNPAGFFEGIESVSRGHDERWLASAGTTIPLGTRVRMQGQLAHSRIDSSFDSPFGGSDSFSRRTGGRVQADVVVNRSLDGTAGFELQGERGGSSFVTATDSSEVPVDRTLQALFGEARWRRGSTLYVTAGVRVDRITREALPGDANAFAPRPDFADDTVVSTNPKVAAAWYVRSADGAFTKLRGSAGTGIRPPDLFELAFTDNPGLKPERSRSFDIGVDQALLDGLALIEATGFYNRYDDLIVAVGRFSGSSAFRTDNISNARSSGLELAGSARFRRVPSFDARLRVAYTLLDTEILAVDGSAAAPPPFEPGDRLLRRPKHQFGLTLLVAAGRVNGYFESSGRGRMRDVEPTLGTFGGIFDAAGYAVANAGVTWRAAAPLEVFARVDNLFDKRYEEVLGFPALGRGALVGVRVAAGH